MLDNPSSFMYPLPLPCISGSWEVLLPQRIKSTYFTCLKVWKKKVYVNTAYSKYWLYTSFQQFLLCFDRWSWWFNACLPTAKCGSSPLKWSGWFGTTAATGMWRKIVLAWPSAINLDIYRSCAMRMTIVRVYDKQYSMPRKSKLQLFSMYIE